MRRARLLSLPVALVAVVAFGCNKGSTDPSQVVPLVGSLAKSASTVSTVTLRSTGNLRVTAVDLQQILADGTPANVTGGIILNVGEGNETSCVAAGSFSFVKGTVLSLGLQKGSYCLKLTEPGLVADDSTLHYEMSVEITD